MDAYDDFLGRGNGMTRNQFEALVMELYGVSADYPFEDDFVTGVFRHIDNRKWFALAMNIPSGRLGIESNEHIDVVNLKCPPEIIESVTEEDVGVYPAYHMNKLHWISVSLGECDEETILWLLDISYSLTQRTPRKRRKQNVD